ncbi:predicted protein [Naegleria gruberi]|uniref:Predicted protein n=1 Tax=Naegleria gruberi TaxID=5762 RepID=D2VBD8_NAEGR|nr:uncharacterized protein NAEGRDRAFT_48170 [Naegleria gruberi]EFC45777.1 predicted protein [Naegleria gruberi]|eukprot:XP_002678521.1 predicted protein [Naegleria gruberi strain NEG-M]
MKNKPQQQRGLGLDAYNSDNEEGESSSSSNAPSEDYKSKKKGVANKRSQEEIKNKIVTLTKKRKQDVGSSEQNCTISKIDDSFDSFKTYIYLPCKFLDDSTSLIEMLLRDVLYRDPYNLLLFSPCTTDPFFVGHHVSLSKTFNVKKNLASEFRLSLGEVMRVNTRLPIKIAFKSISMYLGSNVAAKSDITPTYAIYLAFDLTDEYEERIVSSLSKAFCTKGDYFDNGMHALIDEESLWFSKLHVSFACRLFKDRESQVEYYKECLTNISKIDYQDNSDYPTSFKICSINTAVQHMVGSDLSQSKENRISVTDARKKILSTTQVETIEIVMGSKTFSVDIPHLEEPQMIKETWQITLSINRSESDSDSDG